MYEIKIYSYIFAVSEKNNAYGLSYNYIIVYSLRRKFTVYISLNNCEIIRHYE